MRTAPARMASHAYRAKLQVLLESCNRVPILHCSKKVQPLQMLCCWPVQCRHKCTPLSKTVILKTKRQSSSPCAKASDQQEATLGAVRKAHRVSRSSGRVDFFRVAGTTSEGMFKYSRRCSIPSSVRNLSMHWRAHHTLHPMVLAPPGGEDSMYTAEHKRCGALWPIWSSRAIQVTTHITFFTFVPTLWLPKCEHKGALVRWRSTKVVDTASSFTACRNNHYHQHHEGTV